MQNQIVSRSPIIVRHEIVAEAAVGERDFLSLREIAEGSLDEWQAGVVDHRQIRPDFRSKV
jgi:hypothetical protein